MRIKDILGKKSRTYWRPTVKLNLEALEDRTLLSGPDGGGGGAATWDPKDGNNASNPANWSTGQVPDGTPAIFDGKVADAVCVWDENLTPIVDPTFRTTG